MGEYKVGVVEFNTGIRINWVNLYPKKKKEDGYWDYYCKNPDSGRSKIGLHPGSVSLGCISVPDSQCWLKLETLLKQQKPYSVNVTGVEISGVGSSTLSCDGNLANWQKPKNVFVIGSLYVIQ